MSAEPENSDVIDIESVALDIPSSPTQAQQALITFDKLSDEEKDAANAAVELALMTGDYGKLSPQAKFAMVKRRCDVLGVDMTQSPYQWGKDRNGKVMLIPVKNLYQQLRANKDIKLEVVEERVDRELGIYYLKLRALMANGREETDISAVTITNPDGGLMNGAGIANAMKICWTQAKNRVTGSICAVGGMDESEQQASREAMLKDRLFEPSSGPRMITPGPGVEARQGLVPPRGGFPRAQVQEGTGVSEELFEAALAQGQISPENVISISTPTNSQPVQGSVAAQEKVAETLPNAAVAKPEPPVLKKSQFVRAGAAAPVGRPPKIVATANPPAPRTPQPGPKQG